MITRAAHVSASTVLTNYYPAGITIVSIKVFANMIFLYGNTTLVYNMTSKELHLVPYYINAEIDGSKYRKGYLLLSTNGTDLNVIELKSAHQAPANVNNFRMPV